MRAIVIVIDGMGIGELPDAKQYNDTGSNTLGNICKSYDLNVPTLMKLGLLSVDGISVKVDDVQGSYARLRGLSNAKDTTAGHWEMAGVITKIPFPTFPDGFDDEFISILADKLGVDKILVNKPYSGTEVIEQFGDEHIATGNPILYTSADSVLQFAVHTDVVPLEKLYDWCKIARELCVGKYQVGRVIARPFTTENGKYVRTADRKDFAVLPPRNLLNEISDAGLKCVGVGKIDDIFNGSGITDNYPVHGNIDCMSETIKLVKTPFDGLIFTNLVDTDAKFGHRRDIIGYAQALEEIDTKIAKLIKHMDIDDVLFVTSDHGCDPTHAIHTDHTREYVPLMIYGDGIKKINLGTLVGLDTIADTIREQLSLPSGKKSIWKKIIK